MSWPHLPSVSGPIPGPRSRALGASLASGEAPGLLAGPPLGPIVWAEASGCLVRDVDGNILGDLTGGFGTAAIGHGHPAVRAAVQKQLDRACAGLADVHGTDVRAALVSRLAALAPRGLGRVFLALSGSEAVEIALKIATRRTGRPGWLALAGAYHGCGYGAVAVTDGPSHREPFGAQLNRDVVRAPFPTPGDWQDVLTSVRGTLARPPKGVGKIGAVIVEPVQYRGGARALPWPFLAALAEACRASGALLIADEVATGLWRTGRRFACEWAGVTPDLLCIGKALGGGLPIAAVLGTADAMAALAPGADGEAIHTGTQLGQPLSCAAALAVLGVLEDEQVGARAAAVGDRLRTGLAAALAEHPHVGEVRGTGALIGVAFVKDRTTGAPDAAFALAAAAAALRRGWILLPDGPDRNVWVLSPPYTMSDAQVDAAVVALAAAVREARP